MVDKKYTSFEKMKSEVERKNAEAQENGKDIEMVTITIHPEVTAPSLETVLKGLNGQGRSPRYLG